jgi:mycoredoxin
MTSTDNPIALYTSRFCGHSLAVERFMKKHQIPFDQINIDDNAAARDRVKAINNGYASVPTLIFPDGSTLTEPSFRQLRAKLGMDSPSLGQRLSRIWGK